MHPCLRIPEILVSIFDIVLTDVGHQSLDRKSILAVIKTCRIFSGPALQLLWRTLYTPVPLLLNLPDDLWKLEASNGDDYFGKPRTLTFKRDSVPDDWKKFDAYAPFVRQLGFQEQGDRSSVNFIVLDGGVCRELEQRSSHKVLLPNLQSITSSTNDHAYILSFLTPKVQRMKFVMHPKQITSLSHIIGTIPLRAPALKALELSPSCDWKPAVMSLFADTLHGLLSSPTLDLEEFICPWFPLSPEMTKALFRMPSLRAVSLCSTPSSLVQALTDCPLHTHRFTAFSLWDDTASSLDSLSQVVPLLLPSKLQSLHISSRGKISDINELTSFLRATAEHCSPAHLQVIELEHISFSPHFSSYLQPLAIPVIITAATLRPLLVFSQIRTLTLTSHPFDMSDAEIKELAMAWPQLEVLHFETSHGRQSAIITERRTSLNALLWLAVYCKKLHALSIWFTQSNSNPDSGSGSVCGAAGAGAFVRPEVMRLGVDHNLSLLFVGDSPIDDPVQVAGFINTVFPNLQMFMFNDQCMNEANNERWREVEASIQQL